MESDPPTAILTNGQREYLTGERDPAQERTMRTRIRERVVAAVNDFYIIFWHLDANDVDKIFDELDFGFHPNSMFREEYIVTPDVIRYAVAFFLQHYQTIEGWERAIEAALAAVADKRGGRHRYEVEITRKETFSVEELKEKLKQDELAFEQIRRYHGEGRIDIDAYLELARHWQELDKDLPLSRREEKGE